MGDRRIGDKASKRFTEEELAAMRDRSAELKAAARRKAGPSAADGLNEVLAKISEMPEADRALATRVHNLVMASAPGLSARTWYGQPAYAMDGNVICFFQPSSKFKTRYSTLGFSDHAKLDEGEMWPTAYALKSLTEADEARIGELVKMAIG